MSHMRIVPDPVGGRPKLPEGQARDTVLKVRVKPAAAARFQEIAARRGMSVSQAMRDAMAEWAVTRPGEQQ